MNKYSNIGTIFKKELSSFFNSAIAYVIIVVFLGLLAWFYVNNIFLYNTASMRSMFAVIHAILLFIIPAITMGLLAEEKKSGSIELLATKPIRDFEIIAGKFLSAWALTAASLAPTLLYYITVSSLGEIDHGPVISGYLALTLLSALYISIGLLASSLTENQIVAFIISFVLLLALYFVGDVSVLMFLPGFLASTVEFLSSGYHFSNIARGVVDSRDIIYFFSAIGFTLYLTVVSLERRKW